MLSTSQHASHDTAVPDHTLKQCNCNVIEYYVLFYTIVPTAFPV